MNQDSHTGTTATDRITALKDEGNKALRIGDITQALSAYSAGIELASVDPREVSPKLVSQLFSNRAAVKLQVGDFEGALSDSKDAIKHDSSNLKGFYRAAKAALNLELFKESYDLCELGLNLDSRNRDLRDILTVCGERLGMPPARNRTMSHSYSEEDAQNCYQEVQKLEEQCAMLLQRIRGRELDAARANRTSSVINEMGDVVCYKAIGRGFVKDDRADVLVDLSDKSKSALSELESLKANYAVICDRKESKERELKDITEYFSRKQAN